MDRFNINKQIIKITNTSTRNPTTKPSRMNSKHPTQSTTIFPNTRAKAISSSVHSWILLSFEVNENWWCGRSYASRIVRRIRLQIMRWRLRAKLSRLSRASGLPVGYVHKLDELVILRQGYITEAKVERVSALDYNLVWPLTPESAERATGRIS